MPGTTTFCIGGVPAEFEWAVDELKEILNENASVLDVATGDGGLLRLWGGRVKEMVGLDCDENILKEAERKTKDELGGKADMVTYKQVCVNVCASVRMFERQNVLNRANKEHI